MAYLCTLNVTVGLYEGHPESLQPRFMKTRGVCGWISSDGHRHFDRGVDFLTLDAREHQGCLSAYTSRSFRELCFVKFGREIVECSKQ